MLRSDDTVIAFGTLPSQCWTVVFLPRNLDLIQSASRAFYTLRPERVGLPISPSCGVL